MDNIDNIDIVAIGGNICCGKSSIIKKAQETILSSSSSSLLPSNISSIKYTKVITFLEPIEEWEQFLLSYYDSITENHDISIQMENSFNIQIACLYHFMKVTCTIKNIIEKYKGDSNHRILILVERSPIETLEIFITHLKNILSGTLYDLLIGLTAQINENFIWKEKCIYIRIKSPVKLIMERLRIRNMPGDKNITTSYINKLNNFYSFSKILNVNVIKNNIDTKLTDIISNILNTILNTTNSTKNTINNTIQY